MKKHFRSVLIEDAILRVAKHIENGELLVSTDPVAFFNEIIRKLERPIDADFLARQIVDDLYRAGAGENVHFYQATVEGTIRSWLAGSGRKWGK